ncbi:MAG: MerR family transcriptional regulator [Lachnospiraceae bacterium]|nr:MerR family transcriptional regulator [Lachnospiraceae bacterium]
MKINEVEKRVQITKKNIRFYEQEGLLHPERNKENGYREYSEEDVDVLLKIKFLRKLSLPIEEIRMIQSKKLSLHDALRRHLITLEHEERNLQEICELCRIISKEEIFYETLDASFYLERIGKMEEKGVRFMDVNELDKRKKRNSIGAGLFFIALMVLLEAMFVWGFAADPMEAPPIPIMIVLWLIPLAVIGGIIVVMKERMKEIEGGEENEAAKY